MTPELAARIGLVLVGGHRMFSQCLSRALVDHGIDVLGLAVTGSEGDELVRRLQPQVVLVEHRLPDLPGADLVATIKARQPGVMLVMLAESHDDEVVREAVHAGCSGFLTKRRGVAEVVEAVRAVAAGQAYLTPAELSALAAPPAGDVGAVPAPLTAREREILALLVQGKTNRVIAEEVHLSVNTVRNYVQSLLTKLGAHSRLEAVTIAVRAGFVTHPRGRPER